MSFTNRMLRAGACIAAAASLTMCATATGPRAQVFDRTAVAEPDLNDGAGIIQDSMVVLEELTTTPDDAIPHYLIDRAAAIIVIPSLLKGGFIVGAEHGKGVMSRRDPVTSSWSAPAFVSMSGGSIGWQIGAQSVDVVLLIMNEQGVEQLLEDRFTLGGSASVTAGPVGRTAEAATDAQLGAQILGYSRARGLFAGAVFEGAVLHADSSDIEDFYGERYDLEQVMNGQVEAVPALARAWQQGLRTLATGGTAQGPTAPTAGERLESAVDEAGDEAEDAIDRAGDAIDDAADDVGDRVNDAQDQQ